MSTREERRLRELEEIIERNLREAEELIRELEIPPEELDRMLEESLSALSSEIEEYTLRLESGEPVEDELDLSALDSILQAYTEDIDRLIREVEEETL